MFERPLLLLVEGGDDSAFAKKVIASISNESSSSWQIHEMGGNVTDWRSELEVILSLDDFDEVGRAIGLIMDADADHSISFQRCRDILQRNGLPTPRDPEEIAVDDRWRTGVYLMPGQGRVGALEQLVLDALETARVDLADQYLHEVQTLRGSSFKNKSKSLVQAYLAGEQAVVKTLKNAIEKGLMADPSHDSLAAFRSFVMSLSTSNGNEGTAA
ncbi:DUF3226 domain-containing protein [Arthrobacter sp. KNU-44]|uniref:DUF3226 domain-containing protein n=1 Tax=unclassified Arthrobacter TaxID=235627 RepID=UPI003F4223C2